MIQDMAEPLIRAKLSAAERNFRSRIAQLASTQWFLRGTLSERSSKCGKPNCRCANGELHESVYLVSTPIPRNSALKRRAVFRYR